ncbi:hypothetical protein [Actinomadura formosensis]|uniref:hypothetical protein n=1 Tax=Actinomadura formosensis TaxID=60706 RepID=UPI003D92BE31
MLLSVLYRVVRSLLGLLVIVVRSDLSKDVELLVLRHQNQVVLAENYVRAGERRSAWQAVAPGLDGSGRVDLHGRGFRQGEGCKVALDGNRPQLRLTSEELSELGSGLYTLLATLTGYRAARVGWDPEVFVDPVELRREWSEELAAGALPGLVVAEDVRLGVPMNAFVRFTDGFRWIPYESGRPSFPGVDAGGP